MFSTIISQLVSSCLFRFTSLIMFYLLLSFSIPWYLDLFHIPTVIILSLFWSTAPFIPSSIMSLIGLLRVHIWPALIFFLFTCPYHPTSLILYALSTAPHLLFFSFDDVSDWLSFISSYFVPIPPQLCVSQLLCNVYHPTVYIIFWSFHSMMFLTSTLFPPPPPPPH